MTLVRTRMAPSPTWYLHIGNLRTFLYDYLWAKKNKWQFILRIEDTDRSRYVEDAVERNLRVLEKLWLTPDEWPHKDGEYGPYVQTERLELYAPRLHELCKNGSAYYCFCSAERLETLKQEQEMLKLPPRYDGECRHIPYEEAKLRVDAGELYTIRLKVPKAEKLVFDDMVLGRLEFNTSEVDDQVLLKSDWIPTYHGAVVIDDELMKITHVLRGQEWTSSLPKQILTARALWIILPEYGHLPWVLGSDGKKLSKRTGDVSVESYFELGYLPEALLNFIALLGWNPKTEDEIFTLEELVERFDIYAIHRAGAVLDPVKLDWMNGEYIRKLDLETLHIRLSEYLKEYKSEFYTLYSNRDFTYNAKVIQEIQPRMKRFEEFPELTACFYHTLSWDISLLKNTKMRVESFADAKDSLEFARSVLERANFDSVEHIRDILIAEIRETGRSNGGVLWPVRVALSGMERSPWAFECAYIFGKEETLRRIDTTLEKITPN